jgi:starch synthase
MEQQLRILFVTAEVSPLAQTGGLGDVAGALPPVLATFGHDIRIVMPLYQTVRDCGVPLIHTLTDMQVPLAFGNRTAQVWQTHLPGRGTKGENPERVLIYCIEQDEFFARPGLYGTETGEYPDNALRFIFFCRAALVLAQQLNWYPQVFHCHDWHAALIPAFLRFLPGMVSRLAAVATVFTIHNLAYQGQFPAWVFGATGLPAELFQPSGVEFYGGMNFLKAGLLYADALTTVSPTYAEEICTPEGGFGLDGVVRDRREVLVGILNGVDYEIWNPTKDPYLAAHYSIEDLKGKTLCKKVLLRAFGLPTDTQTPLIGVVSRLAEQKGVDLIAAACDRLLTLNLRLVILGSGDAHYETQLTTLARTYPDRIGVRIGFEDALAHQVQAGSDCLLMPSRYEPCGLTQLYSLRYGTIPIVRAVGGLQDTVIPFDPETGYGTGFMFAEPSADALAAAVREATETFADRTTWQRLMRNAMAQDFSWARSAARYLEIYHRLVTA